MDWANKMKKSDLQLVTMNHSVSFDQLSILDTTHKTQPSNKEDGDLVPSLEHCIRTWLALM